MSRATVVIELESDAQSARDLAAGGVFVPGCVLRLAEECDLVVCGANQRLLIPARVVYVDRQRGAGLELIGFSTEMKAQLAALEPLGQEQLGGNEPVFEESSFDGSTLDGMSFDRAAPPDGDFVSGDFTEPIPLIDLQALDDDLAIPTAAAGAPRDTEPGDDPRGDAANTFTDANANDMAARDDPHGDAANTFTDANANDMTAGDDPHGDAANPYTHANAGEVTAGDRDVATALDGADELGAAADSLARAIDAAFAERTNAGVDPMSSDAFDTLEPDGGPAHEDDEDDEGTAEPHDPARAARRLARNVHERLRGLTLTAQVKLASTGELHERIVLERLYGKNVWETLLRNPRLSPPEVSRIARYGSLPRVLLELIVGNNTWLQVPEVRRALLSNPRLGTDQIMKVLRLTPKHELRLAAIQTAYPQAVRTAARMLMRGD